MLRGARRALRSRPRDPPARLSPPRAAEASRSSSRRIPSPTDRASRRPGARSRSLRSFGPDDVILCLISGGASSLLALPRPGVTLAEKRRAVARLAAAGASILEINRLRTSLSAVKGGRLGRRDSRRG